jgi:GntR family transcriptional regulator/MocR family aminotransferase
MRSAAAEPTARPAGAALWAPLLDRAAPVPLSRQLAAALREAVSEGRFGAGARLPSTRELAAELGIARSTVVAVFEQLAAEGYLAARQGSGYYVPPPLATAHPPETARTADAPPRHISRRAARLATLAPPHTHTQFRPFEAGHAEIDARFIARWKHLAARVARVLGETGTKRMAKLEL